MGERYVGVLLWWDVPTAFQHDQSSVGEFFGESLTDPSGDDSIPVSPHQEGRDRHVPDSLGGALQTFRQDMPACSEDAVESLCRHEWMRVCRDPFVGHRGRIVDHGAEDRPDESLRPDAANQCAAQSGALRERYERRNALSVRWGRDHHESLDRRGRAGGEGLAGEE